MDIFVNPNYNIIGRKRLFLGISAILLAVSLGALLFRGIPLGVDFKGGTLVYLKMAERPNEDEIRQKVNAAGLTGARIQRYGPAENNEVLIALEGAATTDEALEQGKNTILRALQTNVPGDKLDLNSVGTATLRDRLLEKDPLRAGTDASQRYEEIARRITGFRDTERSGLLRSVDELKNIVPPEVFSVLQQDSVVSNFVVRNVEIVGPQVGSQLRNRALLACALSFLGMLVYLSVRFEPIYGATSVLAVFHDVIITLGVFSILNQELSLTVVASLLTLIGYSMNDKIVIFDRVRENLKLSRREPIGELVNRSINQTFNRTMLTAGPTFLTLLALLIFGGEVLQGFALALVVGILVGTYSSFGFAAPLLVLYQERKQARSGRVLAPTASDSNAKEKARVKA